MSRARTFLNSLIDIIYPKVCLACKGRLGKNNSIDELVCAQCWSKIKKNLPPFCSRCGRHLEKNNIAKNICPECVRRQHHFDRAFSPALYEGAMKELIRQFKYNDKEYLGGTLSKMMLSFIKEYRLPVEYMDLIIPVPLHSARLREREFNQAAILSKHVAKEFNKTCAEDVLVRNRLTRTQTELEPQERLLNVKGSFSTRPHTDIKGKNILLVDDVLTTGATCSEAAYTLKNAGANIVFVLTLAN